ncbi:MAG: class I SAM-dependent RNA methyltransferase [Proteobacteria bacterium]|nr:class I SAM-dependent RNA methyltransferase [Pseudomonadota bacterium]
METCELKITGLADSGDGVGRAEGMVHFVPFSVPGDELIVEVVSRKKNFIRSRIWEITRPSADRVEPLCFYFGKCGGCSWQNISYPAQLAAKRQIVQDALLRIGRFAGAEVEPTVPSPRELGYRHRARFNLDSGRFGFSIRGSHKFVPVGDCLLLEPELKPGVHFVRDFLKEIRPRSFAFTSCEMTRDEDGVVSVEFTPPASRKDREELKQLAQMAGLKIEVDSRRRAFVQANRQLNEILVQAVARELKPGEGERVLELFSGSGNFSFALTAAAGSILAIERNPAAVREAEKRRAELGLDRMTFSQGDAASEMKKLAESGEKFEQVLLNPPREGGQEELGLAMRLNPRRIVYISCNPAILARDLSLPSESGYRLSKVTPFDMFPQTPHIEVLAVITRL